MTTQPQTLVVQLPDALPANGAGSPAPSQGAGGLQDRRTPPRPSRGQRRTRGMPGVPLAVGAVNVATAAGAEATMAGGPLAGVAIGGAALAAGVYAMRSNGRYRRGSGTGAAAIRRAMGTGPVRTTRTNAPGPTGRTVPGPRTSRTGLGLGGPIPRTSGPRTSPAGPGRTSGVDQPSTRRTRRGLLGRTTDQGVGPGGKAGRTTRTGRTRGVHAAGPGRARKAFRSVGQGFTAARRGVSRAGVGTAAFTRKASGTAKKGWGKTAPVRRVTKTGIKKLGGRVLWPGIVAGLATLRRRSIKAGLDAWRRKRNPGASPDSTEVGSKVRDRKFNPAGEGLGRATATGGGTTMGVPAFVQSSAEMMGAATVYAPEGMMQVGNDLSQIPEALKNVAEALRIMTQRSNDEDPISPAIITKMGEIYKGLAALAASAEDLGPMFKTLHNVDIQRIEQPRRNEHKWDVSANR
jgi:hypothetical protein